MSAPTGCVFMNDGMFHLSRSLQHAPKLPTFTILHDGKRYYGNKHDCHSEENAWRPPATCKLTFLGPPLSKDPIPFYVRNE